MGEFRFILNTDWMGRNNIQVDKFYQKNRIKVLLKENGTPKIVNISVLPYKTDLNAWSYFPC